MLLNQQTNNNQKQTNRQTNRQTNKQTCKPKQTDNKSLRPSVSAKNRLLFGAAVVADGFIRPCSTCEASVTPLLRHLWHCFAMQDEANLAVPLAGLFDWAFHVQKQIHCIKVVQPAVAQPMSLFHELYSCDQKASRLRPGS
eukprot:3026710-Amphidinium_carterae.2